MFRVQVTFCVVMVMWTGLPISYLIWQNYKNFSKARRRSNVLANSERLSKDKTATALFANKELPTISDDELGFAEEGDTMNIVLLEPISPCAVDSKELSSYDISTS